MPREPLFDADGLINRVPDRDDLRAVARDDVIVHHCLAAHEHGECSYEQALLMAVVYLSRSNKANIDECVRLRMMSPSPPFLIERQNKG